MERCVVRMVMRLVSEALPVCLMHQKTPSTHFGKKGKHDARDSPGPHDNGYKVGECSGPELKSR